MTAHRSLLMVLPIAVGLLASACNRSHPIVPTVDDLMEDRVTLDGILLKCNDPAGRKEVGPSCEVARIAVERLARQKEAQDEARRQQEFERNRDRLRTAEEQRAAQQAQQKAVDPYTMPVVPVEPAPASSAGSTP